MFTYRTEFRAAVDGSGDGREIRARPALGSLCPKLAAKPRATTSTTGLEGIQIAAEGVPLFVEEMAKHRRPGRPARRVKPVPQTLKGLSTERLDRLPELAGVIDVAAVLGREFEAGC